MQLSSAMLRAILGILGVCIVLGASGGNAAGEPQRSGWYVGAGVGANWSSGMEQAGRNRDTICYPNDDCSGRPGGMPDGSPTNPYLTIQDGVDNASPGTIINVAEATYVENVIISGRQLYLMGMGPVAPVIDGSQGQNTIRIQEFSTDVVITNFRIQGAHVDDGFVAGIIIYGSTEPRSIDICNNVFYDNDAGVIPQDTFPVVVNNTFVLNERGFYIAAGSQGIYRNNIFKDNDVGV